MATATGRVQVSELSCVTARVHAPRPLLLHLPQHVHRTHRLQRVSGWRSRGGLGNVSCSADVADSGTSSRFACALRTPSLHRTHQPNAAVVMHTAHGRPACSGAVASSSAAGSTRSPGFPGLGCTRAPPGSLGSRHGGHGAQRSRHVVLCAADRLVSGALFAGPSREVEEEQSWGRGRPTAAVLVPSLDAITAPVREDLAACNANLMNVVGQRHPMLMAAAERIFGAGGKKLRPVLCFLVARATAQACGLRCGLCDAQPPSRAVCRALCPRPQLTPVPLPARAAT